MRGLLPAMVVLTLAACLSDPPPPTRGAAAVVLPAAPGVVRIAGSGALVPAVRLALVALADAGPSRFVLEENLGSTGGVTAAAEGAVDVGLVSRPLRDAERALGLEVLPVATDLVILAAHPSVPVEEMSAAQGLALYQVPAPAWPDGSRAQVLLRDRGESANPVLERLLPGLELARAPRTFRVLYHDDAMLEALATTPGAVGVTSLALARSALSRLKVLRVDGRAPTPEAAEAGTWTATRPLTLVVRPERRAAAEPLVAFFRSEAGARALREAGYARPLP